MESKNEAQGLERSTVKAFIHNTGCFAAMNSRAFQNENIINCMNYILTVLYQKSM
jgi:hypothetical protein